MNDAYERRMSLGGEPLRLTAREIGDTQTPLFVLLIMKERGERRQPRLNAAADANRQVDVVARCCPQAQPSGRAAATRQRWPDADEGAGHGLTAVWQPL